MFDKATDALTYHWVEWRNLRIISTTIFLPNITDYIKRQLWGLTEKRMREFEYIQCVTFCVLLRTFQMLSFVAFNLSLDEKRNFAVVGVHLYWKFENLFQSNFQAQWVELLLDSILDLVITVVRFWALTSAGRECSCLEVPSRGSCDHKNHDDQNPKRFSSSSNDNNNDLLQPKSTPTLGDSILGR